MKTKRKQGKFNSSITKEIVTFRIFDNEINCKRRTEGESYLSLFIGDFFYNNIHGNSNNKV